MLNIAIVEDEGYYAELLEDYLHRYESETFHQFHIEHFRDGEEIARDFGRGFDIILMDIQMQKMDGMAAAEKIREQNQEVLIIFITNRTDYAIRGYEVDALDYIVKPVSYFSFERKLERAIGRIPTEKNNTITLNYSQGIRKIRVDDILYAESEGHNLVYHTTTGDYRIRAKMSSAEEELAPLIFFEVIKGIL